MQTEQKRKKLRLYSIVYVAMETTKILHFTCQSKSFISTLFTCQVSACELQPFSCHDLTNYIYSQTAKTVFSHLKKCNRSLCFRGCVTVLQFILFQVANYSPSIAMELIK